MFNDTKCIWENKGTKPTEPTKVNCWDNFVFNDTECKWENKGTKPAEPAKVNCWDNFVFNDTECKWENKGTKPTEPTKVNWWDNFVFNTTTCTWEKVFFNEDDCQNIIEENYSKLKDELYVAPQLVTPNGDKLNDEWIIPEFEFKCLNEHNRVMLFNRWGAKVFEQENYMSDKTKLFKGYSSNSLDFKNGELLPSGTYFYIIELNNKIRITGYLYLITESK